ncbi:hypothetical protein ABT234_25320 [Streptomyces sp. NPDC001586]
MTGTTDRNKRRTGARLLRTALFALARGAATACGSSAATLALWWLHHR